VDPNHTIVLVSGVTQHAMGPVGTIDRAPDGTSVRADLLDGSTIQLRRFGSPAYGNRAYVLLIEYVGAPGGPDEFIVQDRRTNLWSGTGTSNTYGPIGSVVDPSKVVMFFGGTSNLSNNTANYSWGEIRASMSGGKLVTLNANGNVANRTNSAWQAVEFTGSNWMVQRGTSAPSPAGIDVTISDVGSVANAWVYHTVQTDNSSIDERGHRVWLTSSSNLRIQEAGTATGNKTIQWYVISNPGLNVQHGQADSQLRLLNSATITGFTPVTDLSRSFAWVTGWTTDVGGGALEHPIDMWQVQLTDPSTIALERGRNNRSLNYDYQVVELPGVGGFGSGGAGEYEQAFVTNHSISINDGAVCTPTREVTLTMSGNNVRDVAIANTWQFINAEWETFMNPMTKAWTLEPGDGYKEVLVIFRSPTYNLSLIQKASILLDTQGQCEPRY
jgi:hypothetical protein